MNRYKVVGYLRLDPEGAWTSLVDVKATVEALQADKLMLERGVSAQSALIDGLQSQLIQCTADLEALQRERDEANSHVKFLGATKQANGSFCLDMKKYHAGHRCGRHRDDPWQGIDTEIDCFVCLKQALDAEREKVKGLHEITKVICTHCCEPMEIPSKAVLQTQLTQLQALVRALSKDFHLEDMRKAEAEAQKCEAEGDMYGWNFHQGRASGIREEQFIVYRIMREHGVDPMKAVLDATTPESANGQCQECGGEGVVDSGGVSQFDQPIMIPCGCLPERRRR